MRIKVTFENGKTDTFPMAAGDVYMDNKIVKVEVK